MGETVHGGLAERCRVSAPQLIRIPDRVSFEEAAALPVAYGTGLSHDADPGPRRGRGRGS